MKDVLLYKNFIGSVHFSTDDEIFYGKIEGINDSIGFEGSSVEELKHAFHEAVEDYLELCEINGKQPQKAYKGSFNIRIPPDLHFKAAREAIIKGVSLNQFIENAIKEKVSPSK
ncbi:MAG: type II toxin-antitoxin system HicB family antitoxin [Thermincola sp.]|jgi:predicted HicB family RNase H-like nuclease|nr:type II toxin-antitoxin system HicB family antitoxin [Thermincola sp.]MDT3704463.1 type II toxin-antitoxin system HicB family antitoxin [Thermincola sp.]